MLPSCVTVAIALCAFLIAVPLARHGSHGLLNPDENGYSFQARMFLKGKLMAAPLPGAVTCPRCDAPGPGATMANQDESEKVRR